MTDNTPVAVQEEGFKVFVGNLSFSVTDDSLAGYFSAVGPVASANVIKHGNRSRGYGFVTYATEPLAIAAQQALNKQTFDQREINVELARPRSDEAPRRRSGNRGRGRGRFMGGYANMGYETNGYYESGGYPSRGNFGRRGGRAHRSERPTGEPSTTTLFVANLPFSMDDASLAAVFANYRVVKAHVITLRSGRSKGYGFVEFETESEQKKALAEMSNVTISDRALALKIALNPVVQEESVMVTA